MKFDRDQHYPASVSNVTPAMVEVLATELGVRPEALRALGVGYLPFLSFKKGPNYDGHWTFPERDSAGAVTGLSLRNRLDGRRKPMLPGSKHGLFFSPYLGGGGSDDSRGRGPRWVRVADVGVDCPVCGKPDWCLVDARSPENPAAAICPRTPSNQDFGDAGFLHILDPNRAKDLTGADRHTHPLAPSTDPVVIVEGASDTAAILSLGLVAVGRPSATGGLSILAALVRGRKVVVFGENDEKPDGFWPGKHGAEKTLTALEGVCSNPRIVFPPGEYKDVRQWISAAGLSREAFMEHVQKYAGHTASPPGTDDALPDDNVATVATAIHERLFTGDDRSTLLRHNGSWFRYDPSGWTEDATDEGVRGETIRFLARTKFRKVDLRSKVATVSLFNPTRGFVSSVVDNLAAVIPAPREIPVWLDDRGGSDPSRLICFANGTLDLDAYLKGDATLQPYTADLFIPYRLGFAFDESGTCDRWYRWLEETLGDDPAKVALLQEWFGYNMLPDTHFEKMLFMLGPTRSGKSTALGVLHSLLGPAATPTSMPSIARQYGLHSLVNKLAAIMPDAMTPERDRAMCLERLLQIVGNDEVEVERKYQSSVRAKMLARVTIAANMLPNLPDHAHALSARLMILKFTQSFVGREELGLKRRLKDEMPGVALWALDGLKRLYQNEEFSQPKDAQRHLDRFEALVSPIVEFAETWVIERPNSRVPLAVMWEAWVVYAEERYIHRRTKQWLYEQLEARFPSIQLATEVEDGHTMKYIDGLDLHDFTRNAKRRAG